MSNINILEVKEVNEENGKIEYALNDKSKHPD